MIPRHLFALACAAFIAVLATSFVPEPASGVRSLQGVDVSQYQGRINWSSVARSQNFAIARATLGRTTVDTMYATNKAGAKAARVRFGAYHFAKPDGSYNDAIAEADHFVRYAKVSKGNLIPTLDLEVAGGLGVSALQKWARTWLARVTARTGVRPMIYTSPAFWRSYMGNTTWFASNGYRLWIAHYGVTSPSVPASSWGGRGWTFWQWTSCGKVSGISGCVDRDRYAGSNLSAVTI